MAERYMPRATVDTELGAALAHLRRALRLLGEQTFTDMALREELGKVERTITAAVESRR